MSTRAVGRRMALTAEQTERLRQIGEQRQALPSTRQLARELNISPTTVRAYMRGYLPKRFQRI